VRREKTDEKNETSSDKMEYRYSTEECGNSGTRTEVVHILEERIMVMIKGGNSRFVLRFSFVLAILVLLLAAAGSANAQTWNLVPSKSDEFSGPANSP
jgi:hypothetical protein